MSRIDLDPRIADRLIDGRVAIDDLPAGADRVAQVLEAARRSATESDLRGFESTVAAMVAARVAAGAEPATSLAGRRPSTSALPRLLAGSVAGLTALFGGLAAAGALPAVAQGPVADIVSHVGIDLPHDQGANRQGGDGTPSATSTTAVPGVEQSQNETTEGTSASSETTVAAPPCPTPAPDNHGAYVSDIAHSSTTVAGADNHGASVSAGARSDCGKPQAGAEPAGPDTTSTTQGTNPDDHGGPPTTVEPPGPSGGGNQGNPGGGNGQPHGDHGSSADAHRPSSQ